MRLSASYQAGILANSNPEPVGVRVGCCGGGTVYALPEGGKRFSSTPARAGMTFLLLLRVGEPLFNPGARGHDFMHSLREGKDLGGACEVLISCPPAARSETLIFWYG